MAFNFFEMMASLRMGVDILPRTDPETVPHVFAPGYIPAYTLRDESGKEILMRGSVDELVEHMHNVLAQTLILYEDEYPVMGVG
jgi:hypothetical protein